MTMTLIDHHLPIVWCHAIYQNAYTDWKVAAAPTCQTRWKVPTVEQDLEVDEDMLIYRKSSFLSHDSDIEQSPNSLPPQKNKNIPEPFNLRVRCLNICYI
jgi:hypothetical protein